MPSDLCKCPDFLSGHFISALGPSAGPSSPTLPPSSQTPAFLYETNKIKVKLPLLRAKVLCIVCSHPLCSPHHRSVPWSPGKHYLSFHRTLEMCPELACPGSSDWTMRKAMLQIPPKSILTQFLIPHPSPPKMLIPLVTKGLTSPEGRNTTGTSSPISLESNSE